MLQQKVIEVVAAVAKVSPERVSIDSPLGELGIDSLRGLELLFQLETALDVNIPDPFSLRVRTVRDLLEGVEKLLDGEQRGLAG
jgi:myxalamid-type polyketide synthase MxaE and MxaD